MWYLTNIYESVFEALIYGRRTLINGKLDACFMSTNIWLQLDLITQMSNSSQNSCVVTGERGMNVIV